MSSDTQIQIAYEGRALASHSMDVEQLAPALLAVGQLFAEANHVLNEGRTKVNVRVRSDFEHGCFLANLDIVFSWAQQIADLVSGDGTISAAKVAAILGIGIGGGGGSLIWYLKAKGKKPVKSVSERDKLGNVQIEFEGDHNHVEIHHHVHDLSTNQKILNAAEKIMDPTQSAGVDYVEFRRNGEAISTINKDEAREIMEGIELERGGLPPQVIQARLTTHRPALDTSTKKWRFWHGDRSISVDISETSIAKNALARGFVSPSDTYLVDLEITERMTSTGNYVNEYKVLKVRDFHAGMVQIDGLEQLIPTETVQGALPKPPDDETDPNA